MVPYAGVLAAKLSLDVRRDHPFGTSMRLLYRGRPSEAAHRRLALGMLGEAVQVPHKRSKMSTGRYCPHGHISLATLATSRRA